MLLIQMVLLSMTGSPSLVKQFDALMKLSTVANLVPYVLAWLRWILCSARQERILI